MSGKLIVAGLAVVVLLAAHLLVVGFAVRHLALPLGAAVGLAGIVLAKHLGLLAPLAPWLRHRGRRAPTPRS